MNKDQRKIALKNGFLNFMHEVQLELKKAVWPNREKTIKLTSMVIVISLCVGFLLGVLDNGFFITISSFRTWIKTLI